MCVFIGFGKQNMNVSMASLRFLNLGTLVGTEETQAVKSIRFRDELFITAEEKSCGGVRSVL